MLRSDSRPGWRLPEEEQAEVDDRVFEEALRAARRREFEALEQLN